jgi:uncharacterized protein (DUF305 family)
MPRRLIAVPVLALLAACSRNPAPQQASPQRMSADSAARLEAQYRMHTDSALHRFTAADVAFMTGMISHHAQALVMARLIPSRTQTPAIRTLGARIINAQRDEIRLMQQWLRERGQPVPEPDSLGTMTGMPGMEHMGHDMMPGMLTPEQMQQLRQSTGPAFDRLFLNDMIQHHTGAVTMVQTLFDAGGGAALDETVFKLASGVQVDQTTEINRMRLMLQSMP